MPTGYTADVCDGKQTEFKDFAMTCARAFGALVMMRDEPGDAPIPEEFAPSTYNTEALVKAKARLAELRAMTPAQAEAAAATCYAEKLASAEKYDADNAAQDRRINAMMEKVQAWTPPTANHVEMKAFMLEQLRISLHGDYRSQRPKEQTWQDWLAEQEKDAQRETSCGTTQTQLNASNWRSNVFPEWHGRYLSICRAVWAAVVRMKFSVRVRPLATGSTAP